MKHLRTFCLAVLVGATLVGCRYRHSQPEPMDAAAVQQVRDRYTKLDPAARVGVVVAALPEKGLVAVGDIPVQDFAENDVLVFMDRETQVIAAGKVVAKTDAALHLSYDVRGPEGREPQVGDLAVRTGR